MSPATRRRPRGALLGVLAHELRTPITTIYAGSAVLARDADLLPAMRRELASDVYAEAARLFRAVEDLLVLTRLEHDALRVTREPISLDPGGRRRWPDRGRRDGRGCTSMLRLDGTPPPAAADPEALAHALRNLITNIAWRAAGAADLDITVDAHDRRVECRMLDRTGTLDGQRPARRFSTSPRSIRGPGIDQPGHRDVRRRPPDRGDARRGPGSRDGEGGAVEIGFSLPCYESAA